MGRGSSGSSCIAILNQNLSQNFWTRTYLTISVNQSYRHGLAESSVQDLTRLQLVGPAVQCETFVQRVCWWNSILTIGVLKPLNPRSCPQCSNTWHSFQHGTVLPVQHKSLFQACEVQGFTWSAYADLGGSALFSGYYPFHFSSSTRPKLYSLTLWARKTMTSLSLWTYPQVKCTGRWILPNGLLFFQELTPSQFLPAFGCSSNTFE